MNARSFLGDDRISALKGQGLSDVQIRDYAKNEYQKTMAVSPRGSNLGIDGREIPAAPMPTEAPTQRKGFFSGLGNDLKRTANAFIEDSILGDYGTGTSVADKVKIDVARAQNNKGLIRTLTQNDDEKRENSQNLAADYEKIAKQYGYDLGAIIDGDKIYFGRTDESGQIKTIDATPNFSNHALANKYEIASGVLGALIPGGLAVKMAGSATGSGIGAGADYVNRAKSLNENADAMAVINRALEGATDDLAAGALVGGAIKYGKGALNLGGKALKAGGKLADNSIVADAVRHITADNLSGAQTQLNNMLGGEAGARISQNAAREALGESGYKQLVNDDRAFMLPRTGNDRINKAVDFINGKGLMPIQEGIKRILLGEKAAQRETDMLLGALGHENGAKIILNSIADEPKAFAKADKIFTDLNKNLKSGLDEEFKDAPNVIEVLEGYGKRAEYDFGNVIKTLDENFNAFGVDTEKLSQNVEAILKDALSSGSYITKHVIKELEGGGLNGLQKARAFINTEISALDRAVDAASREKKLELKEAKRIIDSAIDESLNQFERINPTIGARARELMQTARAEYRNFKEIQTSDVFQRITGKLKTTDDLTNILIKSADNQTGLNLDEILSKLDAKDRATIESGLFKNIIDKFTKDGITDFKGATQTLNKLPFKSDRVAGAVERLNQNAALLNNTSEILSGIKGMTPKTAELQQGISTKVKSAFETMARNRIVNKLKSRIPYLGNNQALKNHIANALRNAGDLNVVIRNIDAIPKENMDSLTKTGLEKFKNEIIPEIRQIIKETQGETAEQGSKIESAGAKQEIKGEGWTMRGGETRPQNTEFNFSKDVRKKAKINDSPVVTNLDMLQKKHPNIFKTRGDVARLILAIKDDPTHFLDGSNPQNALLLKKIKDGKTGMIGVRKNDFPENLIVHALESSNKKEIERLVKRQMDRASLPITLKNETGTGAKAHSSATKRIIPQNSAKDELEIKTYANPHVGTGLVAGSLNSIDEDGNFSPERFAAGFLAGLVGGKAVATGLRKMTPKLYNQILGAAEKMPQMANSNPRLLGKLYSSGKDVSLNSFAGEKAITANVGKLDQAKAMLEKGADEVEIWQKTGWFKDEIDGKWKFEINPRGGELKPNPPSNTVLYNVLNDEKLYEAYPQLQLYKVEIAGEYNPAALKTIGSANGGFIPSQKTFIINENATDFKSTLYHEIQHAIQEIEGFSPGASSKNDKYWLAGGEVEARNVQKRMNDVSYDGFKNSTSMEFFPYKEEAQLQRMAGDKEYMEYHKLSKKYSDYLNDKGDGLSAQEEARVMELFEKLKGRLGFAEDDYKKGYELYLKENAEYQKHPLHTLDAPRGERVNIGRGDLNLSRELERDFLSKDRINLNALSEYDQIVNIGKDKAGKEKISSFVNKLKQDELGKLLQKTITNKDLSTKTKIEIIEAAKKRFAKETPKSLNRQSEAQMIVKAKKDDKKQK